MIPHKASVRTLLTALTLLCVTSILVRTVSSSASSVVEKQEQQQNKNSESSNIHLASARHDSSPQEASAPKHEQRSALVPVNELSAKQDNQQASADLQQDKKLDLGSQDLTNSEEYLQVKPEEINLNENGKEIEPTDTIVAASNSAELPTEAEHKSSADDELNAHLAHDTISQQESAFRPHTALAPGASNPIPRGLVGYPGANLRSNYHPGRPSAFIGGSPRGIRHHARLPPSYITLKGKLTGINSIISQYPHPAPGYPHQGPRHLPRGAAAGYAAFRDFVKAHANKYKHMSGPPMAAPIYSGPLASAEMLSTSPMKEPSRGYANAASQASKSGSTANSYGYGSKVTRAKQSKVTVAQAYIPHIAPQASGSALQSSYKQHSQSIASHANPILSKLYGNHAPQGIGRPEYSKDYGMVIHYPQATVYTEPMTVDQLHKLTDGGISQIIEQLQYNLAHGPRDESNIIRANNVHHIGNGVTIHAKEYYAPGKSGHYVPTTAAIISTQSKGSYGEQPLHEAYPEQSNEQLGSYGSQQGHELGAGYERVKQAVAKGQNKNKYNQQQTSGPDEQQQSIGYAQANSQSNKYNQNSYNGDSLAAITNLIGAELESLYKANAALNKQLEPEIHSQIMAYAKSPQAKQPLRYKEINHQSPLTLTQHSKPQGGNQYSHNRGPRHGYRGFKGIQRHPGQHQSGRQNYGPKQSSHEQQAYKTATDQALNQQMMQLLHEFQVGEDQYNGKDQPIHTMNQGYPQKLNQKYNQQQQNQGNQQAAQVYAQHDGLEIPHGQNDQIGEISELIEALKGALETSAGLSQLYNQQGDQYGSKQTAKQEDVRFLASALGQGPSYAMQVPVALPSPAKDESYKHQQEQANYQHHPMRQYQAPQSQYQQPHAQYQPAQSQYQNQPQPSADKYQQPQQEYSLHQVRHQQSQQQVVSQTDYNSAQQKVNIAASSAVSGYGTPVASYLQAPTGSYEQSPVPVPAPEQLQTPTRYSLSEHSQIINHVVPAVAQQAQSSGYDSGVQQPANQIAIAPPTESQYQQAKSISSFVDSLPIDYQELLRQPALLDSNSGVAHLAVPSQETVVSSQTNATTSPSSNSYEAHQLALARAQQPIQKQQTYQSV